jgi:hypothetical protein
VSLAPAIKLAPVLRMIPVRLRHDTLYRPASGEGAVQLLGEVDALP